MAIHPDITLRNQGGEILMVVEVKAKHHTAPQWAAELRRNLLAREGFRPTQYFLIVTPDRLYLWKEPKPEIEAVLPDFVVDSRPLFFPYLQKAGLDLDRLSAPTFELLVISWLSELVYARQEDANIEPGQTWLLDSGFLDAAKNGELSCDHAA